MSDNPVLPAAGTAVRAIDRVADATSPAPAPSGVTQVTQLDVAGATGPESLVSASNPLPTRDAGIAAAASSDSPLGVFVTGDPNGDFAGVNIIEQLVDDGSGLALNVRVLTPLAKTGADGGLMLSDAVVFSFKVFTIASQGPTTSPAIDTQGYASFNISSDVNFAGTIQFSDDLINWTTFSGFFSTNNSSYSNTVSSGSSYVGPILGRYVRVFCNSVTGSGKLILRSAPLGPTQNLPINLALINNTTPATGGITGSWAVGGTAAAGALVSTAGTPVLAAGSDSSLSNAGASAPVIRIVKTDTVGRVQVAPIFDHTSSNPAAVRQMGMANPVSYLNSLATNVQDTTQFEGQSIAELLAQILLELRILNQQTYEMSALINGLQLAPSTTGAQLGGLYLEDDPATYRADPTIFNQ